MDSVVQLLGLLEKYPQFAWPAFGLVLVWLVVRRIKSVSVDFYDRSEEPGGCNRRSER